MWINYRSMLVCPLGQYTCSTNLPKSSFKLLACFCWSLVLQKFLPELANFFTRIYPWHFATLLYDLVNLNLSADEEHGQMVLFSNLAIQLWPRWSISIFHQRANARSSQFLAAPSSFSPLRNFAKNYSIFENLLFAPFLLKWKGKYCEG